MLPLKDLGVTLSRKSRAFRQGREMVRGWDDADTGLSKRLMHVPSCVGESFLWHEKV